MIINSIISGNGGLTASIFVTGLHETDTVTATNPSGDTISAVWNGTEWVFLKLKEYGTYTITATDGTNTATQDLLVDMAIQFDVEMTYFNGLKLYWLGDECEDVTGGWAACSPEDRTWTPSDGTKGESTLDIVVTGDNRGCMFKANNTIDLTGYTKLKYTFNRTGANACVHVTTLPYKMANRVKYNDYYSSEYVGEHTGEMDISSLNISYVIAVGGSYADAASTLTGNVQFSKVWLE